MSLFLKRHEYEGFDIHSLKNVNWVETSPTTLGKITIGGLALLSGYLMVADSRADILGDTDSGDRNEEQVQAAAFDKYQDTFGQLPPADKFTLQYGAISEVEVRSSEIEGNGFLGWADYSVNYSVSINNACLNATAYDIDGGSIEGNVGGLFVSGSLNGDFPTSGAFAEISREDDDMLIIHSGNSNSTNLYFSGVQGDSELTPADENTSRILETYGCKTAVTGIEPPIQ